MKETKKLAPLYILKILEKYSDPDHPLTHNKIAAYLINEHGIEIERKAIGRNISFLEEAGYDIITVNKKGSYLATREFDNAELRLLIDGVIASTHITEKHAKELIEKLCNLSNVYFRGQLKNIFAGRWSRTENNSFFYNISVIDEAIENGKQVIFYYNKYQTDKELHKSSHPLVSPYHLILHNQHYYLMAFHEYRKEMHFYRLDRITNIKIIEKNATPLTQIEGYKYGIDYHKLATAYPYMFNDYPEKVDFYVDKCIVDQVVDWFGNNVTFNEENERLKATVWASPMAMECWALQYLKFIEIVYPESLREKIKDDLKNGLTKYE